MYGDTNGDGVFSADGLTYTITPSAPLQAGGQFVVLVEPAR